MCFFLLVLQFRTGRLTHNQLVLLHLAPPHDSRCLVPQLELITGAG